MLQRLTSLVLILFVALNINAQEDEGITYSFDLPETMILADGMTFEEYLVKQVLANAKPLKKHIETLRYSVTCQLEKDIDLTKFPHRRTIMFAARLAGYGPIVSALREHKLFGITMAEDVLFHKGKITTSNVRMVEMKQELTEKQKASFLKHDDLMSANIYDQFYKRVSEKAKELQKKYRKKQETGMQYVGSYTVDNRTFYTVMLDNMRIHIAEGCWQISRISYVEGENNMSYEFKEVSPNLFLLSRGTVKMFLDRAKWPKGFISMKMEYDYQ